MANERNSTNRSGLRQRTHDSVDKVMDKAESMRESAGEGMAQIKEKTDMMRGNVDGYIRKNPETSVLIAAGVGAIVGGMLTAALINRRR
ncbi:MAG: DUF883 C-terminal domain-containing protein [archaeon]